MLLLSHVNSPAVMQQVGLLLDYDSVVFNLSSTGLDIP